ncbi:pyridoxal-phosphate dependent enzyme [Streptosporangium subroseum]|uniref:pyridoxal-phosphate dependent enzyme n=1 Tax=Streptosporangium subroseum TaxID=106412 RepID=UPI00342F10B8
MTTRGVPIDADAVDDAAGRLAGVVSTTPLERNTRLSDAMSAEVWLKREDLQTVRSYKVRGAFNLIAQLDDIARAFDDARTIAGQGTVIREAVEQLGTSPDVVVLPVGGGGLLAGSLTWLAQRHPQTRVIGVEPEGAAGVAAALAAGEPVTLSEIDTFVDGAAVRRAGAVTFPIIAASGVELVAVPEGRVCSEILALYQTDGIIAEPAGALASAALGMSTVKIPDSASVVCVLSGGNNDVSRYAEVVERALIYEERKHYFLVEFPQEPGALRRFLDEVLGPNEDITLFEYVKRSNRETGPALVGIELASPDDLPSLLKRMETAPPRIERIDASSPLFRFLL